MADPGYTWRDGHPQRKHAWRVRLASGPVPCSYPGCAQCGYPPCDLPVHGDAASNWDGKTWHLGHRLALKHGGDGADSTPWHQTCNLRESACMTNHGVTASRDWWEITRVL